MSVARSKNPCHASSSATNWNPPASTCCARPASRWTSAPASRATPCKKPFAAADGVIVRSGTQVTAELLEDPGKLRAVVRAGVGVDNIDVAAATRKGIVVMNTPGGNTVSTAEQTIDAADGPGPAHRPPPTPACAPASGSAASSSARQLAGKTLGVIGLGRIGREVARRAVGLDMKVVGFDPVPRPRPRRPARHRERRPTSMRCCRAATS